jgi:hypothetical protein
MVCVNKSDICYNKLTLSKRGKERKNARKDGRIDASCNMTSRLVGIKYEVFHVVLN